MSDTAILKFNTRETKTKGANNALLHDGYLLGNISERGKDSTSISIKKDEFRKSLHANGRNAIYTLEDDDNNSYTVMVKDIQLKPLVNEFHHVDFQVVSLTEEITIDVMIDVIGHESVAAKGFIVNRTFDTIPVTGFPQNIPDTIEVDVTGFGLDDTITMADIKLDKVTSELDDDELIVSINEPKMEAVDEDTDEESADAGVEVPVISDEESEE